jgi:hypothetical protein
VKNYIPTRRLPDRPDLDKLRRQAKEFLEASRAGTSEAAAEIAAFYGEAGSGFALHDAQLVLARSYGYDSWPKLKAFVDGVNIQRLVDLVQSGDSAEARTVLRIRPELVNASVGGYTPLHYAVLGQSVEMVRTLLQFGADPHASIYPYRGATSSLAIAEDRGYDEIAAALHESRAAAESQRERPNPHEELFAAVRRGDIVFLQARHARQSLIPPRNDWGWLLQAAVEADRPEVLKILLDLGLDPDARVEVGDADQIEFSWGMPLYACARTGKHEMAKMLLERGADPNAAVYASGTPLSEAYGQRDERMIALLESYGGRSNASMAGLYRRKDLAEKLLAKYGDAVLPDDGFSSGTVAEQLLGTAARGGDPEILRIGMERVDIPDGDRRWHGLLRAPLGFWNHWIGPWCHLEWDRNTYLKCFRLILAKSGPPIVRARHGLAILHEIVTMGDHVRPEERVAFATAALDAGAELDARDDVLKSTPLGWAARWGRAELVPLFLQRGADPTEPDAEPWATPLAWAEKKGFPEIVRLLRR